MVKLIILLLLPGLASAQMVRKKRAQMVSRYDSIPMQYTLQNVMFKDSATERIDVATIKNGKVISFPQDTLKLAGYLAINGKTNLTLAYGQVGSGRTYTRPARTLNNIFTPNASRDAFVNYTVSISTIGAQSGAVYLEVSANSTTWVEAARVTAVGVSNLPGIIPAGYLVRLRTTGTATIAYLNGIETSL